MAVGKFPVFAQGRDIDLIALTFQPNGTGVPVVIQKNGRVTSVTRSGTGEFLVTLTEAPARFLAVIATWESSVDNEDIYCQTHDYAADRTSFKVKLKTGTSDTDVTQATGKYCHVLAIMEDSNRGS